MGQRGQGDAAARGCGGSDAGASRAQEAGAVRAVEALGRLGRRLAGVTTPDDLRDALRRSLPDLDPAGAPWVLIRGADAWEAVAGGRPEAPHRAPPALEAVAERALRRGPGAAGGAEGTEIDGQLCFPLVAGGALVGVLGARRAPRAVRGRRALLAAVAAVLGLAVRHVRLLDEVEAHSACDPLTGCRTRASGLRLLDAALARARRAQQPVSLVMLDLDDFKSVNDRYGHLCGDAVLAAAGARLRAITRSGDVRCRFGGDEFLVLLPDTAATAAAGVAAALRREIARIAVRWRGVTVSTTASIGVASVRSGAADARALIAQADAALYRAKDAGRNRVCVERGAVRAPAPAGAVLYSPGDDAVDAPARQRGH